ncbi:hypothetical protein M430DRAFT_61352 [Amorphotheca resinae ATCC 22711]|uniref:Uncharacterized protein n=1 Tax=Amorphotheca resinae ATCC 22711 TaxID=857342 RepID=A0A2T3ARF2_AMORE|nr:hypothetical protein M430DRAFT_61352 [Amorphotheca resinae ATCC 22711]PSS08948.1 hypothetical protein M430DRAFT_61352 [Amorphotheca resinae ATCC 22711]
MYKNYVNMIFGVYIVKLLLAGYCPLPCKYALYGRRDGLPYKNRDNRGDNGISTQSQVRERKQLLIRSYICTSGPVNHTSNALVQLKKSRSALCSPTHPRLLLIENLSHMSGVACRRADVSLHRVGEFAVAGCAAQSDCCAHADDVGK